MKQNKLYNTAIYCRLSLDDGNEGDSSSIKIQKMMLEKHALEHGFTISHRFTGTKIHSKFRYGSRVIDIHNRVDGIDDAARLIYELKPYNKINIRQGIRQLYRYQKAVYKRYGFIYDMILVVY